MKMCAGILWNLSFRGLGRGGRAQLVLAVLACAVVVVVSGCSSGHGLRDVSSDLGSEGHSAELSLPRIVPPERWELDNGLTVLFSRDDEIPVVSGNLFLRGGNLWEPIEEFGVSIAMGDLMRRGGAGSREPEELDQRLDELSASVSSSMGQEFGRVQFGCLSSDLPEVFGIFADVVRRPRFDEKRLDLWKSQSRESMRRRVDDPSTVAVSSFNQLIFGKSPYGWVLTEADLGRFTPARVRKSYERFIQPDGALLAISGRVEREEVEKLVAKYFGSWEKRELISEASSAQSSLLPNLLAPPPAITTEPKPGIFFIELPLQQATILVGHRGVPRLTPDYLAIEVFNSIFGSGGFGSRLMKRVRTEAGLAYSVYGSVVPAVTAGKNIIFIQTKTDSAGKALSRALEELATMQEVLVPEAELQESKDALLNSFVFNFESPAKVLIRNASFQLLGYPADYDKTYMPGMREVSAEQVREVARKRWNFEDLSIVVVGNKGALTAVTEALEVRPELQSLLPIRRARFDQRLVLE